MSPDIAWTFEPVTSVILLGLATLYLTGWRRARARGAPHPPGPGRLALFLGGSSLIGLALMSPLDSLGDQMMVMHMVQHMLLLDIAPIMLILALTKGLLRPITRRINRLERRAGLLAHPVFAVLAYAGALWLWHVPALYDAAQGSSLVHVSEHVSFTLVGGLYWWHVLSPIRSRLRLGGLGPVAYMTSAKILVGLLGVGLAFAPGNLYPFYAHQPQFWGLTPRVDQNLAGLVMAAEQSIVMGIALAYLFVRMLRESEREAERAERYELV